MTHPLRQRIQSAANAAGFGLIELMIGILIGSILLLGLGQVFSSSRAAYQTSEGLARVQENSRFAMDFLQRDLRMVGHMGCVNDVSHLDVSVLRGERPDLFSHFLTAAQRNAATPVWSGATYPLQFDIAVQGYEATSTTPGNTFTLPADPIGAGVATSWTPNLPAALMGHPGGFSPVTGSDIVVLRFFDAAKIPVTAINTGLTPTPITIPASYYTLVTAGSLYGLSNCGRSSVFAASTSATPAGVFTVANALPNKSTFADGDPYTAQELQLYPLHSYAYYIGLGTGGGPALMRLDLNSAAAPQELVDGIENLQVLYGRDQTAGLPDGLVDTYWTATQVEALGGDLAADWRRVGTVRIGFIARSPDRAATTGPSPNSTVLGVTMTPPAGDGRLRETYTSTVAMRNRLYSNR